ncbi:small t antigen [Epsilonpolyomavirus bovis]|uniref:Small t antigen n=3 Tax=Bovine polyomavirus TaxID=1891754 RepID=ST_POVBO|nr:small t antigen [Epsilonpolyomavirus bovis]P24852.3 RecName: Full=Small t antigen; Short=ST; Short=ST-AG [Epsilonpolyomavirus bovis]AIT68754.1 small t antigen [Bovine polyomavirus 1]ALP46098.1 small T antigen [Bovine polyomavirus 1]QSM01503.1 MAG: small T antigen [Epsilonpolyomavirus bovis]UUA44190.1 small T antigen [Bovine polyomavirus 1]UXN85756.1 small T antigen [Epsilonpolyomavirus bovis]
MELTSEEYEELRGLLGTPDIGNADTLKKAFLKACKVHHPDKGGNEEAMKRLLYLYNKAKIAASATTSQVWYFLIIGYISLKNKNIYLPKIFWLRFQNMAPHSGNSGGKNSIKALMSKICIVMRN